MSGGNFKEAAPSRAGLSPRRPAARRQRVFEVDPLGVGAPGQGPGGAGAGRGAVLPPRAAPGGADVREEEGAAAESAPRRPPRPALPSSRRDYWGADAGGAPPRCWPLCGHSSFIHQAHCRPSLQSPNFPSPAMGPLVVGCERKSGRMERALAAGCPGRWGAGGLQVWGGFASARSPHLPPSLAQSNVNPVPARSPPGPWRRRRQAPQPLLWGGGRFVPP